MTPTRSPLSPAMPVDVAQRLELALGLSSSPMQLLIDPGALSLDVHPGLGDTELCKIDTLGTREELPHPEDWRQVLSLLLPGEELLWIVDLKDGEVAVHLGLRPNRTELTVEDGVQERSRRFAVLANLFSRQAFPGSELRHLNPDEAWTVLAPPPSDDDRGWFVAGQPRVPSDADDMGSDGERSLNDVVEACLHLGSFRLVFVTGRVQDAIVEGALQDISAVRGQVHALATAQRTATDQTTETTGTSVSQSDNAGGSRQEHDHLLRTVVTFVDNLARGIHEDSTQRDLLDPNRRRWEALPASRTWSETATTGGTITVGQSSGASEAREEINTSLILLDERLERMARLLDEARGEGGFRTAILIWADGPDADLVAATVRGVVAAAGAGDHPVRQVPMQGTTRELLMSTTPVLSSLAPAVPVLAPRAACRLLLLPEAELPGCRLRRSTFFGRNAALRTSLSGRRILPLGPLAFGASGPGCGTLAVPIGELYRHVLVTGTTGSGKTWRVLRMLDGLAPMGDALRVVVFETAKRTYRDEMRRGAQMPLVYTLGDATAEPFRINPFFFEPGTSLKRHISVLSNALSELLPTESLIGPYMRSAVERCFLDAGWDLETGKPAMGGSARVPTVLDFVDSVDDLVATLQYGGEVNANYRGALLGRAQVFLDATYQDLFSHDGDRPIEELFPRDTIIEFEQLPASELDLPGFVMALVLERLRAAQTRAPERGWLLVVEEAHNVLGREQEGSGSAREGAGGHTLLKNFVRLLQEGRSLKIAVMVVDQSPAMLARSVVKNTNTKVILRLEDGEDIDDMGRTLGLPEEQHADLGLLRVGEAVVKTGDMTRPARGGPWPRSGPAPTPHRPPRREPPDYVGLDTACRAALEGRGPIPDDAWLEARVREARDRRELVAFAWRKGARQLRAVVADYREVHGANDVLIAARRAWRDASGSAIRAALAPVEALLLAAASGAPRDRGCRTGDRAAAASLIGRDPEEVKAWAKALDALAFAPTTQWLAACSSWSSDTKEAGLVGPEEVCARLRAAVALCTGAIPPGGLEGGRWATAAALAGDLEREGDAPGRTAAVERVALRAAAIVGAATEPPIEPRKQP
jgi:hypothetical protein